MTRAFPDTTERILATRRPQGSAVMRQKWSELLFLHWPLAAEELRPLVPQELEVDVFDGKAWIGIVPFRVSGARARFLPPLPPVARFDEVNLRTYVHRGGRDPGVWFFSLDASSRLAVQGGRALYKLPYRHAGIRVEIQEGRPPRLQERWIDFVARRVPDGQPDLDVRYRGGDVARASEPGTLEHFLVERYILYSRSEKGLHLARVHHHPYPLQPAVVDRLRETLTGSVPPRRPPKDPLAHYASGVDVEIFRLRDAGTREGPQRRG